MRELKFRAWTMGVMLYSGKDFSTVPVNNQPLATKDGGMATNLELMQYTGLKDKNGNDVYESDIVKYWHTEWNTGGMGDKYKTAVIEFKDGGFNKFNDCEVIGNIYQDSELLEDLT